MKKDVILLLCENGGILFCSSEKSEFYKSLVEDSNILNLNKNKGQSRIKYKEYTITSQKILHNNNVFYLISITTNIFNIDYYKRLAYIDSLTNLHNRNFWEHLKDGILNFPKYRTYGLIIVDMDNLKSINDNWGHSLGDEAIRIVSQSIKESIRKKDIPIRYGGDEFIIIIPNVENNVIKKIINRIKYNLSLKSKNVPFTISVTFGFANTNGIDSLQLAFEKADYFMYKRKKAKLNIKEKQIKS
ncbi:diguanylate cyclase (GGDEF) domain-containing protein [Caloranaerobacter azorensis DSM 13643]|uniref:Diguanylate cyclase (GGDEF) domain-containing protein n=1 Tax=Caloranaerobacter azorensis DSM 13643 TaxID=1121264 RepID=A0A1M5T756_9FIRM|nr:diguanylate cyclase [Caloranaerobacter azorensis]SHH46585.1 diguanylate cyclase (GGDEF) domain-containing protein [Caloranaerobacter azorensis DSM 13643]